MIRLDVSVYNGLPMGTPLSVQFDELGGSIGRADTNQLVLPDPERTVSRVHARVVFRASGGFAVVDQGSNAISVNGVQLGKGREAAIKPGDSLQIGGYTIRVEAAAAAGGVRAGDPFADFLGLAPAQPAAQVGQHGARVNDPLGLFGAASAPATPTSASVARAAPGAAIPSAPVAGGGIPADWDPFAAPPPSRQAAVPPASAGARALGLDLSAGAPTPLIPDLPGSNPGASDSLDALFGLGAASPPGNLLGQALMGEAAAQPNMSAHADPVKALGMLPAAAGQSLPDRGSDLNRPFQMPAAPAAPALPGAASPTASLPGAVMSWTEGAAEGRTIIRVGRAQAAPAAPAQEHVPPGTALADSLSPMSAPVRLAQAAVPPTQAASASASARPGAARDASADATDLLAALREGLQLPELQVAALTPAFMRLLGELLHESARGTVDLLLARAALKREVRADATMIVAKENNPLKFSPSAEVALGHLLGPPVRGFVEPQRAMRDAFDDLRAHQLAFLAGMRAALEGLLQRFDPAALESRLTQKSMLSALLPGARKAQLWSVFQQEYAHIAAELSDDFHQVFGREFLRAYEAQLDALHAEKR